MFRDLAEILEETYAKYRAEEELLEQERRMAEEEMHEKERRGTIMRKQTERKIRKDLKQKNNDGNTKEMPVKFSTRGSSLEEEELGINEFVEVDLDEMDRERENEAEVEVKEKN